MQYDISHTKKRGTPHNQASTSLQAAKLVAERVETCLPCSRNKAATIWYELTKRRAAAILNLPTRTTPTAPPTANNQNENIPEPIIPPRIVNGHFKTRQTQKANYPEMHVEDVIMASAGPSRIQMNAKDTATQLHGDTNEQLDYAKEKKWRRD